MEQIQRQQCKTKRRTQCPWRQVSTEQAAHHVISNYHSFLTISQKMNQKGLKKRYVNALAVYFRRYNFTFQQAITQSGAEGGGGWLNSVSSFISKTFYWWQPASVILSQFLCSIHLLRVNSAIVYLYSVLCFVGFVCLLVWYKLIGVFISYWDVLLVQKIKGCIDMAFCIHSLLLQNDILYGQ